MQGVVNIMESRYEKQYLQKSIFAVVFYSHINENNHEKKK